MLKMIPVIVICICMSVLSFYEKPYEEEIIQGKIILHSEIVEKVATENSYEPIKSDVDLNIYDTTFKAFMHSKTLTNKSSNQYKLQLTSNTDSLTGVFNMVDNRYSVAIATSYNASVGDYVNVYLDTGKVIPAIVGDIKADADTDESNSFHYVGDKNITSDGKVMVNLVEFIVDNITDEMYLTGDVSCIDGFDGNVLCVELL